MDASSIDYEGRVRDFAATYDTPNTRRAILLCEVGRLRWADVYEIFVAAIIKGRAEVSA
jgi:hypothetical protein